MAVRLQTVSVKFPASFSATGKHPARPRRSPQEKRIDAEESAPATNALCHLAAQSGSEPVINFGEGSDGRRLFRVREARREQYRVYWNDERRSNRGKSTPSLRVAEKQRRGSKVDNRL